MRHKKRRINYADDDNDSLISLLRLRAPSLLVGLALGVLLSLATSRLEEVLAKNIQVAFFIPFVVYMADAVGTQTQAIYTRDLKTKKASFKKYLVKETCLGIILGAIASVAVGGITMLWFSLPNVSVAVSLAMFFSVASAPLVALLTTEFFELGRSDPAASSGPISTVIQDTLSILIYGQIVSWIIL